MEVKLASQLSREEQLLRRSKVVCSSASLGISITTWMLVGINSWLAAGLDCAQVLVADYWCVKLIGGVCRH